jgi:hypothetical protein
VGACSLPFVELQMASAVVAGREVVGLGLGVGAGGCRDLGRVSSFS